MQEFCNQISVYFQGFFDFKTTKKHKTTDLNAILLKTKQQACISIKKIRFIFHIVQKHWDLASLFKFRT